MEPSVLLAFATPLPMLYHRVHACFLVYMYSRASFPLHMCMQMTSCLGFQFSSLLTGVLLASNCRPAFVLITSPKPLPLHVWWLGKWGGEFPTLAATLAPVVLPCSVCLQTVIILQVQTHVAWLLAKHMGVVVVLVCAAKATTPFKRTRVVNMVPLSCVLFICDSQAAVSPHSWVCFHVCMCS